MNQQKKEKKIIYPSKIVKDLSESVEKLEMIGCIKESKTLLEKIVAFSNYQDIQTLQKLCTIYEHENNLDAISSLWKKSIYHTLFNKNDEQFLKIFSTAINYNQNNLTDLESAISLYARSHELFCKSKKINHKEELDPFNICIVSTTNTSSSNIQLIEKIALNNNIKDFKLTCYFIDDAKNNEEQSLINPDYLESLNCKIVLQNNFISYNERLVEACNFIRNNNFDCLIYLTPLDNSILNFLIALKALPYQVAIYTDTPFIQNEIDLALFQTEPQILNNTPYYTLSRDDLNDNLLNIIHEYYLEKIKAVPKQKNQKRKKKDIKVTEEKKLELTENKEEKLNSNIATEQFHPIEKRKSSLSDTTSSIISKDDIKSFWNDLFLKDSKAISSNEKITDEDLTTDPKEISQKLNQSSTEEEENYLDLGLNEKFKESDPNQNEKNNTHSENLITAIEKLQKKEINEALEIILNIETQNSKIKNLYFIKALCFTALGQHFNALNAIQSELGYFPDNEQALKLLNDINDSIEAINKKEE